jgi:hypothetical protein
MPSHVELERADFALVSDLEGTRVVVERLQVLISAKQYRRVTVQFEGDDAETGFRGQGRRGTFQMTARFLTGEHQALADLVDLFDLVDDDPDGRILFRTHLGEVDGLNDVEAILVSDVSKQPVGDGTIDVSFNATAVRFTAEV